MFEDRYYQIEADDCVASYLKRNPDGHPLVAMPTGSGKTAMMIRIIKRILKEGKRILVLSHDSRILEQNYKAIVENTNLKEVGLFSAGLKSKTIEDVTVAGIQSAYKQAERFKNFDYVIIDEAHTIPMSDDSMYRKFLDAIGKHTRIGLTATPYKLGHGYIVGEDHIFTKIVIDYTTGARYNKLVKEGFLCPLVINDTKIKMDTEGIGKQGDDFNLKQMSSVFDREALTNDILDELVIKAKDRNKWLIFAIDIEHANHVCEGLISRGVSALPVHSDSLINVATILLNHRNGTIRCVVSVGMLTTGYDDPSIDLIGLLRPTQSPNLHVQMPGRGQRTHPSKKNCLVLDYAGNTARLGPINKIVPYKKKKGKKGAAIIKTCPDCDTMVSPMTKICPECGYEYKFRSNLELQSASDDIIYTTSKWFSVSEVEYSFHLKAGRKKSIKVSYVCGLRIFNDWILPDNDGYSGKMGRDKLKNLGHKYIDIESAMAFLIADAEIPSKILIDNSGRYPSVIEIRLERDSKGDTVDKII